MAQILKRIGKASAAVLATIMAPQVGKDDMVDAIGYIENAGVPSAVVPDFIGQMLFDTSNNTFYRAFGTSAGNWTPAGTGALTAAELNVLDGITPGTPLLSKALVLDANLGIGAFRNTGLNLVTQVTPTAKTTSATLTAAEILTGIITGNQGAAGAAAYTMPLATDWEIALIAAFPGLQNNDSFDFSVINISAVASEDITMTTNTGWTLVGSMVLEAREATQVQMSQGLFRARRTAANTYTLYRIS